MRFGVLLDAEVRYASVGPSGGVSEHTIRKSESEKEFKNNFKIV